ncbi:MAG TPA: rod shape-determining protein MreC [Acidimicrobiales bacterium]|nr:rod shape-determining protein MreC [Acidimicrobiales bacterium]
MARPRRSRRTLTTVVVLVLVSFTIITIDQTNGTHHLSAGVKSLASDVFSPLRNGVNDLLRPVGDFFAGAVDYGSLQTENQKLQATIGRLRMAEAERPFEQRQLQEILALQHLPFLGAQPTVSAQTTQIDVSNFDVDITIGKGRSDGVGYAMPVVGAGGLVGQVVQANHHSSIVQLITDGQSKVGVVVGTGSHGATAVLDGQGPGSPMTAVFVAATTALRKGDRLYTSGLQGAQYPAGIPVGRVTGTRVSAGGAEITAQVSPLADLGALAYVDVVQWVPAS